MKMRFSASITLGTLLMLLITTALVPSFAIADDTVTFPDPNLEAHIRNAIQKPSGDIYAFELEAITALGASDSDISDLTGLEYCTNLTKLYLMRNRITDLSPLSDLTSLTGLWLRENQISDVTPLENLSNLTVLGLRNNQISDIGPLVDNVGLDEMDVVDIHGNPLNETSINTYVPELEQRGVIISWDTPVTTPTAPLCSLSAKMGHCEGVS